MKTAELVVELGAEEIPASMLEGAGRNFAQALLERLQAERIPGVLKAVWYTPRRIVVGISEIAVRQPDLSETVIGPPRKVAYDSQGSPTRAAIAFAQKNGVALSQLKILETPKGEYLSLVRRIRGVETPKILRHLLPEAIEKIPFPKTMHWSSDKFRFARPLRWIVALYRNRTVRFGVADVVSGSHTSGHRFLGKSRIRVDSLESLRERLRENGVLVDPAEREARIREGLSRMEMIHRGRVIPDPDLLRTVVNLNEYPTVISGEFESRFLGLPQEILVTVMREHQKYFSMLGEDAGLLPVFLACVNLESPRMDQIREGHERVLRARLADAWFFWETDRKVKLMDRLPSLRQVLFQEKIGSYYDKTQRILSLLPRLAETAGCMDHLQDLEMAGRMAKCDLVTEMVKEFTDLQGVVGGLYACAEGYPEAVWRAVYEHYLPKTSGSASPATRLGALLALADRLDTVCGCFSVGLIPSGSRDPFAVRRQGNGIMRILLDHRIHASLNLLICWGLAPFGASSDETDHKLKGFFEERLRFLLEEAGHSYDSINAGLAVGCDDPLDAMDRIRALQRMHDEPDFLSLASNYKRIVNILAQGGEVDEPPDPAKMSDAAEHDLWQSYLKVRPKVEEAGEAHDYGSALLALASMRSVVDRFFDDVLVMTPDLAIRHNRLALLSGMSRLFLSIADISQIVL
jgi:glycyl-tRNA synthetase beta chain